MVVQYNLLLELLIVIHAIGDKVIIPTILLVATLLWELIISLIDLIAIILPQVLINLLLVVISIRVDLRFIHIVLTMFVKHSHASAHCLGVLVLILLVRVINFLLSLIIAIKIILLFFNDLWIRIPV